MQKVDQIIAQEIEGCFNFFWNESNTDTLGFGLTKDMSTLKLSSIAAVGFAFCAYVIGSEWGFKPKEEIKERVEKTIDTLLQIKTYHGFFPHFIDPDTLGNHKSEYSTIDTTLLLSGGIVASEYFGGTIKERITKFIEDLDWRHFMRLKDGKWQINMGYSMERWKETDGFCPATWDQYAEQLIMYFLCANNLTKDEAVALYQGFERHLDYYEDLPIIHCYANPLFIHQFSHAFFPFQDYLDMNGVDWFRNSINATLANRSYSMKQKLKGFGGSAWGLTACHGEHQYLVYGAPPFGFKNIAYNQTLDGTIAPYGAICSINFTPEIVKDAILNYYQIPKLFSQYGFTDTYNLTTNFVSDFYLGIDKGPTIVMLDNYLHGTTWKYFTKSEIIKKAINKLNFQKKEKTK